MKIVNLTQHSASTEQHACGVFDLQGEASSNLKDYLTFDDLPRSGELVKRATGIAAIAAEALGTSPMPGSAMVGGAPYLMAPLESALRSLGITPLYAFSKRESAEAVAPDGTIKKVSVFRHLGFVEAS